MVDTDTDITKGNVRVLVTKLDPNKEMPSILSVLPFEEGENPSPGHVISAATLPGIRSRNKKFWDPKTEESYKDVYSGNIVLVTRIEKFDDRTKPWQFDFGAFRDSFDNTVTQAIINGGFEEADQLCC
ncbi:MAG: hypothetical protein SGARI_003383 [Bacillariaceae sp.]